MQSPQRSSLWGRSMYGRSITQAVASRSYPLLVEVKYKPSDASLSRNDLNQVVAYGVSYESRDVVLLRPRGASADNREIGLHRLGTIGEVAFHHYVFDLDADDLRAQEGLLGEAIGALLGSPATLPIPRPVASE